MGWLSSPFLPCSANSDEDSSRHAVCSPWRKRDCRVGVGKMRWHETYATRLREIFAKAHDQEFLCVSRHRNFPFPPDGFI